VLGRKGAFMQVYLLASALALSCVALGREQPAQDARASPSDLVLPAGTVVHLRTAQALTSKQVKPGERIQLEIARDVKIGSLLVVPRHTQVIGMVTSVQPAQRAMRSGRLAIEPGSIKAITGETIPLEGRRTEHGGPSPNDKAQAVMEGYIIFSWVPFLFKGDEASLAKGTLLSALVGSDVPLNTASLREAAIALEEKNAAERAAMGTSKAFVHLYRDPRNGGQSTIELDDHPLVIIRRGFLFDLQLSPGVHTVRSKKEQLTLEFKANEDYYIRVDIRPGFWHVQEVPVADSRDEGEDATYALRPVDRKDVLDPLFTASSGLPKQ